MGGDDRRLVIGALCGINVALAAAFMVGQHVEPNGSLAAWSEELARLYGPHMRHLLSRKNCATTIQSVGAVIAFYGLLRAYLRAKYNEGVWEWIESRLKRLYRKLFHTPQQVVPSGIASGTFGFHVAAHGLVTHNVDITLPLQEQIKQLARFVNDRSREAVEMEKRIGELGRDVKKLEAGTVELERNLLERIETQIKQLDDKINRVQVLDLTSAIWGLGISFVGTVWSFGT